MNDCISGSARARAAPHHKYAVSLLACPVGHGRPRRGSEHRSSEEKIMRFHVLTLIVAALGTLAGAPAASAQCAMMSDHAAHGHDAVAASDKGASAQVNDLLMRIDGRRAVVQAVLADSALLASVLTRALDDPTWQEFAASRLDYDQHSAMDHATEVQAPPPAPVDDSVNRWRAAKHPYSGVRPSDRTPPAASAAVYVCPMHPDVTSAKPGKCPQCGMTLERRPARQ